MCFALRDITLIKYESATKSSVELIKDSIGYFYSNAFECFGENKRELEKRPIC